MRTPLAVATVLLTLASCAPLPTERVPRPIALRGPSIVQIAGGQADPALASLELQGGTFEDAMRYARATCPAGVASLEELEPRVHTPPDCRPTQHEARAARKRSAACDEDAEPVLVSVYRFQCAELGAAVKTRVTRLAPDDPPVPAGCEPRESPAPQSGAPAPAAGRPAAPDPR